MKPVATCLAACLFLVVAVAAAAQDCMPELTGSNGDSDDGKTMGMPMQDGHGGMADMHSGVPSDHCEAIREAGRLFQERCSFCHDSAAELARSKLVLKEDGLYGRYSERAVVSFLMTHARLSPSQVPMMIELLEQQLTQR